MQMICKLCIQKHCRKENGDMGRLAKTQYKLDISKKEMKALGFRYDRELGDYIYKFSVYQYNKSPLLFCKIGIDEETKRVWFNIYDTSNVLYAPYYNNEYGNNDIIPDIEKVILSELDKLGVTKVK